MVKKINIIHEKADENFAKLLSGSLTQVAEKNNDVQLNFNFNPSPGEINIIINKFNLNIESENSLNIIINTKKPHNSYIENSSIIDFFYKNLENDFITLSDPNQKEFWLKVYDVFHLLENNPKKEKYAYVAPCAIEQDINRDIIKRELLKEGYAVLPLSNVKQTKEQITKELAKSEFSVHILDSGFGNGNSISEYHNTIAADYVASKYNASNITQQLRFIWISPDLNFVDENQKLQLEKIRQDIEALKGAEIIQTPIELFKNLLKKRIESGIGNTIENLNGDSNFTYVIHEENDDVSEVIHFFNQLKVPFAQPNFQSNEESMLQNHRTRLVQSSGVFICGLNKNKNWIESKIKDIQKAPGFGKKRDFNRVTLLVDKKSLFTNYESTLNIIESIDKKEINEFIKTPTINE